jgi:hypothetical protein
MSNPPDHRRGAGFLDSPSRELVSGDRGIVGIFDTHNFESRRRGGRVDYSLELGKQVLRRTPRVLDALLSDLSEDWIDVSEGPDSWTPRQVVGHLTYVEENDWIDRTRVILEHGANTVFEPIDREGGFERFADLSLPDLLNRFASIRHSNVASLDATVREGDLHREGSHPDFGLVTLDQLLSTWVVHDLNHLGQIVKTLAKQYSQAVGPWRAFLPIVDAP